MSSFDEQLASLRGQYAPGGSAERRKKRRESNGGTEAQNAAKGYEAQYGKVAAAGKSVSPGPGMKAGPNPRRKVIRDALYAGRPSRKGGAKVKAAVGGNKAAGKSYRYLNG